MLDPWILLAPIRDDRDEIVGFSVADLNTRARDYTELSAERTVGDGMKTLLSGPRGNEFLACFVHVMESGVPLVLDSIATSREGPGGEVRYFDVRGTKVDWNLSLTWRDVTDRAWVTEMQARSQALLRAGMDSELDPHVFLEAVRDADGFVAEFTVADANPKAAEYYGRERSALIGMSLRDLINPAELAQIMGFYSTVVETGEPLSMEALPNISPITGEPRFFDFSVTSALDGVSVTWRDVTRRVERAKALAESEERFRLLSMNAAEMILLVRDHRVVWMSPSGAAFLNLAEGDTAGIDMRQFVDPEDVPLVEDADRAAAAGKSTVVRFRARSPHEDVLWMEGHISPYLNADGAVDGVLSSIRVIDDIVRMEQELDHRARHDMLTGLLNRSEAFANVTKLAQPHPRTGTSTALLFCDIDKFKEVNDTFGHVVGDEILRCLADRISHSIRADDFAARVGGDELLIVLVGVHDLDEAVEIVEKVRGAAAGPIDIDGKTQISTSLSIGVTLARPNESIDALIERADNAMYAAKGAGRNRVTPIA